MKWFDEWFASSNYFLICGFFIGNIHSLIQYKINDTWLNLLVVVVTVFILAIINIIGEQK